MPKGVLRTVSGRLTVINICDSSDVGDRTKDGYIIKDSHVYIVLFAPLSVCVTVYGRRMEGEC